MYAELSRTNFSTLQSRPPESRSNRLSTSSTIAPSQALPQAIERSRLLGRPRAENRTLLLEQSGKGGPLGMGIAESEVETRSSGGQRSRGRRAWLLVVGAAALIFGGWKSWNSGAIGGPCRKSNRRFRPVATATLCGARDAFGVEARLGRVGLPVGAVREGAGTGPGSLPSLGTRSRRILLCCAGDSRANGSADRAGPARRRREFDYASDVRSSSDGSRLACFRAARFAARSHRGSRAGDRGKLGSPQRSRRRASGPGILLVRLHIKLGASPNRWSRSERFWIKSRNRPPRTSEAGWESQAGNPRRLVRRGRGRLRAAHGGVPKISRSGVRRLDWCWRPIDSPRCARRWGIYQSRRELQPRSRG